MSTQHETPKTPRPRNPHYHTKADWNAMDIRDFPLENARYFAFEAGVDAARRALADHAAELAALHGVRGPVCPEFACGASRGACPTCDGTGHMPFVPGSVAGLVRAAREAERIAATASPYDGEMGDLLEAIAVGLNDALAAFDLDEGGAP